MRLLLLMFAMLTVASAQIRPPTPPVTEDPSSKQWLEGSIGQRNARMYLDRGGKDVVGVFYYTADWEPFLLGGSWRGDALELHQEDETCQEGNCPDEGVLRGNLTLGRLAGTWNPPHQSKAVLVELKVVPALVCDGKGAWRSFRDSRWPITFAYPASWRLKVTEKSISITCPDPSLMAYEGWEFNVTQESNPTRRAWGWLNAAVSGGLGTATVITA